MCVFMCVRECVCVCACVCVHVRKAPLLLHGLELAVRHVLVPLLGVGLVLVLLLGPPRELLVVGVPADGRMKEEWKEGGRRVERE